MLLKTSKKEKFPVRNDSSGDGERRFPVISDNTGGRKR